MMVLFLHTRYLHLLPGILCVGLLCGIPVGGTTEYIQDPYILVPAPQPSRGINLACYAITSIPPFLHSGTVTITWRRNGMQLEKGGRYNISTSVAGWSLFHISSLSIRDVRADERGDTYACQTEVVPGFLSDFSEEYVIGTRTGGYKHNTEVREGSHVLITLTIPISASWFHVIFPNGSSPMTVDNVYVYIQPNYRSRLKVSGVSIVSDDLVLRFLLHNVTVADAGRYYCLGSNQSICQHDLYVLRTPTQPCIKADGRSEVGENISLTCSSTSRNLPQISNLTYIWRRDSTLLQSRGRCQMSASILTITYLRREDRGGYSCQSTEAEHLVSDWSLDYVIEWPIKPEILTMTVNGTSDITVSEGQTVMFVCEVEGYPPPDVVLLQDGNINRTVIMDRSQRNIYSRVMHIRSCSQLGSYFCEASNELGTTDWKRQRQKVTLKALTTRQDAEDSDIATLILGKHPMGKITLRICAYPHPVSRDLKFTKSGHEIDFTENNKYHLTMENTTPNVFVYTLTIYNFTDNDFGVYKFRVSSLHGITEEVAFAYRTSVPERRFPNVTVVVGCSIVAITLILLATIFLIRLEHIKEYWNLRFRQSYLTPTLNMDGPLELEGDGEYAVIDDTDGSSSVYYHMQSASVSSSDYEEVRPLPPLDAQPSADPGHVHNVETD